MKKIMMIVAVAALVFGAGVTTTTAYAQEAAAGEVVTADGQKAEAAAPKGTSFIDVEASLSMPKPRCSAGSIASDIASSKNSPAALDKRSFATPFQTALAAQSLAIWEVRFVIRLLVAPLVTFDKV